MKLPNPYHIDTFTFQATNEANNRSVDRYPQESDQRGELDLFNEMMVTFSVSSQVEAKVRHYSNAVAMEVYRGCNLLSSQAYGTRDRANSRPRG